MLRSLWRKEGYSFGAFLIAFSLFAACTPPQEEGEDPTLRSIACNPGDFRVRCDGNALVICENGVEVTRSCGFEAVCNPVAVSCGYCGDGTLDPGEACDDQNQNPDDGCHECALTNPCDPLTFPATCEENVLVTCEDGQKSYAFCGERLCSEDIGGCGFCGDGILDPSQGEECEDLDLVNGDGCDNNCTATACGNGIKTAGEACDDGDEDNTDACLVGCREAYCGDGFVQVGVEQCDPANDPTCKWNCTPHVCGDGIRYGSEMCDDGNTNDNDFCRNDCTVSFCGDGLVNGDEQCEDGNDINTDACLYCRNAYCGDGVVQAGVEACDSSGLGCYQCQTTTCGDGIKTPDEACDDGNTAPGDGCRANCGGEELCGDGLVDRWDDTLVELRVEYLAANCGSVLDPITLLLDGNPVISLPAGGCYCEPGMGSFTTSDPSILSQVQSNSNSFALAFSDSWVAFSWAVVTLVGELSSQELILNGPGTSQASAQNRDARLCDIGYAWSPVGMAGELSGLGLVGEACDFGFSNSQSGYCLPSCEIARCGDGFVRSGFEECDDANQNNADGCYNDCQIPACGDGIYNPYEVCLDDTTTFAAVPGTNYQYKAPKLGDWNNDGHLDIAVLREELPYRNISLLVFHGNGAGAFQEMASTVIDDNFNSSGCCNELQVADINNDGFEDFLTKDFLGSKFGVIFNNANGTFAAPQWFSDNGAWKPSLAFVNNDAFPDIIAGFNLNHIRVFLGNGNGTFQSPIQTEISPCNTNYESVVEDFNLDGRADFACYDNTNYSLRTYLGNGNGTFQSAVVTSIGVEQDLAMLSDLNGDSKMDIVFHDYGHSAANTLINNGDGTFQKVSFTLPVTAYNSRYLADITNDGKTDLLIVLSAGELAIYPGQGDGTFGQKIQENLSTSVSSPMFGDVNEDGGLDLVFIGFIYNNSAAAFTDTLGRTLTDF